MKSHKHNKRAQSKRKFALEFQKLEPKNLLAGISFDAATGVVTVEGSNAADAVLVQPATNNRIRVQYSGVDSQFFDANNVSEVVFFARNGDDWFRNDTPISSRAYGHNGDDMLIGGSGDDRLRGGPGIDRLMGQDGEDYLGGDGGDDFLIGGNGHDRLDGFWGNDRIWGQSGNDFIIGGAGDDYADGGDGNDRVYGYSGDDQLKGGNGSDFVAGHAGADWISGGYGSDQLFGNGGRDQVFGSFGDDDIFGGDGSDDLYGNSGLDDIYGGNGDDDLRGGSHSDLLQGGSGNDDFYDDRLDNVIDDAEDYSPNGDFEIRGNVANLNTSSKTFSLLGITVDYTNAEFVANIQNGSFVKTEGTYDGTTLRAHEVENEVAGEHNDNFEARGIVSNLNTNAQTFDFLGFTVDYSGARVDSQPANGSQIFVEGVLNGAGIVAHKLEDGVPGNGGNTGGGTNNNGSDGDLELRGFINNFNPTAKTFDLLGLRVSFSNAQLMGQFGNGSFVKVEGRYNGTQIAAREVETEAPDNRSENFEAQGVISNLNTNTHRFEFLGFTVDYNNARVRTPLANGSSVEIEGSFANFFVNADDIR